MTGKPLPVPPAFHQFILAVLAGKSAKQAAHDARLAPHRAQYFCARAGLSLRELTRLARLIRALDILSTSSPVQSLKAASPEGLRDLAKLEDRATLKARRVLDRVLAEHFSALRGHAEALVGLLPAGNPPTKPDDNPAS